MSTTRLVRYGFGAVGLAAIAFALANSERGVDGTRLGRPDGAPAYDRPDLLGIDRWYLIFEIASLAIFFVAWGIAIARSRRQGRWTPTLLMLMVTTSLVWLDPIMNWAPYAAYDPRMFHFDVDWWWINLAPTVEPWAVIIGYGYFFLLPAWFTLWLYRRIVLPKAPPESWWVRHPIRAILTISFGVCVVWDALMEMIFVRLGVYTYTQVVPHISVCTGEHYQFPLILEAFLFGAVLCVAAPLMWRDDRGLVWSERIAMRHRVFEGRAQLGAFVVALGLMSTVYVGYGLSFGVVRATGIATETAQPWPYPEASTFDPQGYYEDSGALGPFQQGTWAGWEHRR